MAQNGDIVFSIGADVTGLTRAGQSGEKSLAEMERAGKKLESQLLSMGKTAMDFKGSVANLAKENKSLYEAMRSAGEAAKASQVHFNGLLGVNTKLSQSARDSAAAFEAFEKSKAQVDNLRASIDPLFAASKRYEQALQTLDTALEQGTISARQHEQMVEQLGAAYLRADGGTAAMGGRMGLLGSMSDQTRGKIQQVGFQVQDFAVQVGAGTSATQAFAQQFPQLAGAFGPVGVAVGTLAAVLVPLGVAFLSTTEEARSLEDTISDMSAAVDKFTASSAEASAPLEEMRAKYGRLADEAERALDAIVAADQIAAMNEIKAAIDGIASSLLTNLPRIVALREGINPRQLADDFGLAKSSALALAAVIRDLENAKGIEAQVQAAARALAYMDRLKATIGQLPPPLQEAYDKIAQMVPKAAELAAKLDRVRALLDMAAQAAGGAAAAVDRIGTAARNAYSGVADLVSKMWEMGQARGKAMGVIYDDGQTFGNADWAKNEFGLVVPGSLLPPDETGGGGGGAAGGGGANPVEAQLEQLRQQLMTEEQLEMESFAKRQEMLQQALEQRLLTQQEYAALMEQAQQAHADKMSEIDVWRYGTGLDKAATFFGDMASAMQGGNERMLSISKKFAAAEALINAWQAFSQVLADKTLPFWAKIPSAMKVLAAGMGAVNAIKGGGGGGGAGGGKSSATAAAPQTPVQTMNFTIQNDPFGYGERFARSLAGQMNSAQRNGSRIVATVTST